MTTDIAAITLPEGIHAEILRARDVVTGEMVSRGVVWADRTYPSCGTCGQAVPRVPTCPVTINDGDGRGSQFIEWSQRHNDIGGSCGIWQSVLWAECGASETEILGAAQALAATRAAAADDGRKQVTATLRQELADALRRLAADEAGEDDITTGSDMHPGVYLDHGQWVAWDFDPDDDSEVITVCASGLAS